MHFDVGAGTNSPKIDGIVMPIRTTDPAKGGALMTPAIRRVRELVVSYRPLRVPLPVTGTASGPREAARLAAAILVSRAEQN